VPEQLFDPQMYAATSGESLAGKPTAQQSYLETYPLMLQPTPNTVDYQRFYYQLQETVNREIKKVIDGLNAHPGMADETVVIFTSDHGDMLGAHGGMHQKWHQAYEEASHVPFIFHNRKLFSGRQKVATPTSHADVIPTMLGLAGLNAEKLRKKVAKTHDEAHPLVGRDLSPLLLGERKGASLNEPVYFMTDDEVSRGSQQISFDNTMYPSVIAPNHLETVVVDLPTGSGGAPERWKYSRYFDSPEFWSQPPDEPPPIHLPPEVLPGSRDPATRATLKRLDRVLKQQRKAKRRTPSSGKVPGQLG
jgi:hypothetical protein